MVRSRSERPFTRALHDARLSVTDLRGYVLVNLPTDRTMMALRYGTFDLAIAIVLPPKSWEIYRHVAFEKRSTLTAALVLDTISGGCDLATPSTSISFRSQHQCSTWHRSIQPSRMQCTPPYQMVAEMEPFGQMKLGHISRSAVGIRISPRVGLPPHARLQTKPYPASSHAPHDTTYPRIPESHDDSTLLPGPSSQSMAL
ncbi:hypothetical protein CC86DRAFT_100667 [Ophiobolus disseminans]|uniref:Uncharacterized protein n=1 Tax=Ophiobolus disseminans TaxID=1469910 RepID=A0A6A6ZL44_9PLEO|nr:hypothetical protein CC86DRAFT_100667 [Ophiobolus disseminans]